jgi:hypothetical protein
MSTIPIRYVVAIGAAEGLLYQARRELDDYLKKVLTGSENPEDWAMLEHWTAKVSTYSFQYTRSISDMIKEQERG